MKETKEKKGRNKERKDRMKKDEGMRVMEGRKEGSKQVRKERSKE
jgi:hypothetical protein